MLKKFYILSFIALFFLSTTGLPLSLHLCAMLDSASLTTCEMCSSMPAQIETSCCSENDSASETFLTKTDVTCCEVKLVDKKVNDNFFSSPELRKVNLTPVWDFTFTSSTINQIDLQSPFTDTSPPAQSSGKKYIDISLLLI